MLYPQCYSSYFIPILSHFMVDMSLASLGLGFYVGGDKGLWCKACVELGLFILTY